MKRPAFAALCGIIALTGAIICLLQTRHEDTSNPVDRTHPSGQSKASIITSELPGRSRDSSLHVQGQASSSAPPSPALMQLRKLVGTGPVNSVCRSVDLLFKQHEEEAALPILQEICSHERDAVVQYTLAAGDGSSTRIKLALYLAAMNHASEVIRSTARIEVENITGETLDSPDEVRNWLGSHDRELRLEEAQALSDQEHLEQAD